MRSIVDALLDYSIFYSFDRSGFERHRRRFLSDDLDVDMAGRVCAVTGANSGIGFATAMALATRGAEVWMLCRNSERAERARGEILETCPDARVRIAQVDMGEASEIQAFAASFDADRLDVLVHNAGLLPDGRRETSDGLESTLAVHVTGPFLLTRLLREPLSRARGRVIFVSSGGMYSQKLSLDDTSWTHRPYDGVQAYAQTKRMQVVLSELLAERLHALGISVHSMHPGWADTPAVHSSLPRFARFMEGRLRTREQGADTLIWLAVCPAVAGRSGLFWFDREPWSPYLIPWTREDARDRQALWDLCASATGTDFDAHPTTNAAEQPAHGRA